MDVPSDPVVYLQVVEDPREESSASPSVCPWVLLSIVRITQVHGYVSQMSPLVISIKVDSLETLFPVSLFVNSIV